MVILVFHVAAAGARLVIAGVESTVKLVPLLLNPEMDTAAEPVVAPLGTGTTMLVILQDAGVAETPLNVTVLLP